MKKKKIIIIIACLLVGTSLFFSKDVIFSKTSKSALQKSEKSSISQNKTLPAPNISKPGDMSSITPPPQLPTIGIPDDKQQMIGVQKIYASVSPLSKTIRTVGRVQYDERKLVTINTKFDGWIEKLYVNYTGKYVRKGEPVAEIYSPELLATQQELINAVNWKNKAQPVSNTVNNDDINKMLTKDAESIIAASEQRLRLWNVSNFQIHEIEKSGKPQRTITIYSPASGYVIQKAAFQGTKVTQGEKLFDIADLSTVWILADIYEQDLSLVKIGQKAAISLSYFPGKKFTSVIDFIYPALSNDTRTSKVRFTIPNPDGHLKPEMFTNVEIAVNMGKKLLVPDSAIIDTGEKQIVYIDKGHGNFEPRNVQTGMKADGMVEIISGLKPGEKAVSSANFLIDSEAKLKGVR